MWRDYDYRGPLGRVGDVVLILLACALLAMELARMSNDYRTGVQVRGRVHSVTAQGGTQYSLEITPDSPVEPVTPDASATQYEALSYFGAPAIGSEVGLLAAPGGAGGEAQLLGLRGLWGRPLVMLLFLAYAVLGLIFGLQADARRSRWWYP